MTGQDKPNVNAAKYAKEEHFHLIEQEMASQIATGTYVRYRQHLAEPLPIEEATDRITTMYERATNSGVSVAWIVEGESFIDKDAVRIVSVNRCIRVPCDRPVLALGN